MAGRHRKPTETGRQVARISAFAAMAAAPLGVAGTASAAESTSSAPSAPSVERSATWEKLAHQQDIVTRPLLLLGVMLILVGIQLLSLGLVADVVGRTYHEAQGRPPYYVRKWINRVPSKAPPAVSRTAS